MSLCGLVEALRSHATATHYRECCKSDNQILGMCRCTFPARTMFCSHKNNSALCKTCQQERMQSQKQCHLLLSLGHPLLPWLHGPAKHYGDAGQMRSGACVWASCGGHTGPGAGVTAKGQTQQIPAPYGHRQELLVQPESPQGGQDSISGLSSHHQAPVMLGRVVDFAFDLVLPCSQDAVVLAAISWL